MKKEYTELTFSGEVFNTLALNGTDKKGSALRIEPIVVPGEGSKIMDANTMKRRAKRKLITKSIMLSLVDVATVKNAPDRVKSYWNTWHCLDRIVRSDGRIYGKYCKNRFCLLCADVRKAKIINRYMPEIKDWERPCMTTLTVRAVPKRQLKGRIEEMLMHFQRIVDKYNKRYRRGKGIKLMGLRSLECNFNATNRTYNPHFHILVPNPEVGVALMEEWKLAWSGPDSVSSAAQQTKSILNREQGMKEVVKYFAKIFSLPNPSKRNKKQDHYIYANALDNIIEALQGHHTFNSFGFKLAKSLQREHGKITLLEEYQNMKYDLEKADWVASESVEGLTGFIPDAELSMILEDRVDSILQ